MKIGIITFWESNDNYGQQLQCWALQQYLRGLGYKPFLIRQYAFPKPLKAKLIKRLKQSVKDKLAEFLINTSLAYNPFVYKKCKSLISADVYLRKFPQFRRKNLKMSKIYNNPSDLSKNPPYADVYIAGSDQVWNHVLPDEVYANTFLQFGPSDTRRISYAPSIGHIELPDDIKRIMTSYLKSFSAISVREKSAVRLIRDLGYDATHVLDPSMLLSSDKYLQLAREVNSKPNVFIYSINYASAEDLPFEQICTYAEQRGLPIIVTPGSGYLPAKELFEGVEYSYASIPEWIQHIAKSELVVTASFHGIVFAILFHRPFIYTPLKGKYARGNSRILDLLNDLDLMNRVWMDGSGNIDDLFNSSIDWNRVDEKISAMRQTSYSYLKHSLNAK